MENISGFETLTQTHGVPISSMCYRNKAATNLYFLFLLIDDVWLKKCQKIKRC